MTNHEEHAGAIPQDPWRDDPTYPPSDWHYQVANGDTRRGYWDWVVAMRVGAVQRREDRVVEPTHTEGPWGYQYVLMHKEFAYSIWSPQNVRLATVAQRPSGGRDEELSNARLIAAAPELLEALRELLDTPALNLDDVEEEDGGRCGRARAAISHAMRGDHR